MKNLFKTFGIIALMAVVGFTMVSCGSTGGGGGLPTFGAELGKQSKGPITVRLPYTSVTSYFGYAKPGAEPDAVVEGRKTNYIYIWVPIVAPELGVRMISPVPKGMSPKDGDFVSPLYASEGTADTTNFFDTWIQLERADGILNPSDFSRAGSVNWTRLASNDDSSEMPKNPAGNAYNSLLRHESDLNDPLKMLVRGLYRVAFTTYKRGEVQGTFLAQLGAPIDLPGVVIGTNLEEMRAQIEAASN
jgi:hypothetical protein